MNESKEELPITLLTMPSGKPVLLMCEVIMDVFWILCSTSLPPEGGAGTGRGGAAGFKTRVFGF